MIEAFLVAGACLYGTGQACDSGEQAFFKYNKLDTLVQKEGDKIKKQFPNLYMMGIVLGAGVQKKYDACLWGPVWGQIDVSNVNNQTYKLIYKLGF